MKLLFGIGLVVLVLGALSLFVPIPRSEHSGVKAGGVSLGIETHHDERLSPVVSGLIILAGAGLMVAGGVRRQA